MSPLEWAQMYTSVGWFVVPVRYRGKQPFHDGHLLKDWENLRLTAADLPRYFKHVQANIGVLLGEPSGWLVDGDLDCVEAIPLAEHFLVETTMTFGRASKLRSHWLSCSPGASTKKFTDVSANAGGTGSTLVELRASGQTVFPGSVHTSGEPVEWSSPPSGVTRQLVTVDAEELRDRVTRLAVASLLMRHGWSFADAVERAQGDIAYGVGLLGDHVRRWLGIPEPSLPGPAVPSPRGREVEGNPPPMAKRRNHREARQVWLALHPRRYPRAGSTPCPTCCEPGGCTCWGAGKHDGKWSCFNSDHEGVRTVDGKTVGHRFRDDSGAPGFFGDGLDWPHGNATACLSISCAKQG